MDHMINMALLFDSKSSMKVSLFLFGLDFNTDKLNPKELNNLKNFELRLRGDSNEI
jgi:hypothetical protein